jgi:hypothetical protein
MNKIELTVSNKKVSLSNDNSKIKIKGMTWADFSELVTTTSSSFELEFFSFKDIKNWDGIVEYFTYLQWHPDIKVLTKLEKKEYNKLPEGVVI